MEGEDENVDIKARLFGGFVAKQRKGKEYWVYEAGFSYWKHDVPVSSIDVAYLRYVCVQGFVQMGWDVPNIFSIWYKEKGKTWTDGKRRIDCEDDVRGFIEAKHRDGYLELFQTVGVEEWDRFHPRSGASVVEQDISYPPNSSQSGSQYNPSQSNPRQSNPSHFNPSQSNPSHSRQFQSNSSQPLDLSTVVCPPEIEHSPELRIVPAVRKSPRFVKSAVPVKSNQAKLQQPSVHLPLSKIKAKNPSKNPSQSVVRRSPRLSHKSGNREALCGVSEKGKGEENRKGLSKAKRQLFKSDECGSGSGSSSSDVSDLDIDWVAGEEELGNSEEEDADWFRQTRKGILGEVVRSLEDNDEGKKLVQLVSDIGCKDLQLQEEDSDSDELRSLNGSDEEEEECTWFREDIDFKKPIVLQCKQKFSSSKVLRKALRIHAIENRYEFYYLHNGGERITTFCRKRCKCEWNPKRSILPLCTCSEEVKKCEFKVGARRLFQSTAWQIKELRLTHKCMRSKMNACVTSEFLAEKYVEEWRSNPNWKIKSFRARVLSDLGIQVGYSQAWLARARAKLMIYGSASEQYARVWDYSNALLKSNPDSSVYVVCEGMDRPQPPLFMRMYVCLEALKNGFNRGCRPLIGLDGCHLKGTYPGQILVAVGKDGNNQIFPFAWATVEVENKDTWAWFLDCLKRDLGDVSGGLGLTFMSDRQKGLLEAFDQVMPLAEKRFCVRHIWANFKLQFTGSTFKELFWSAARATTLVDFEVAMESIKFLSEDAYEYLANIPATHWSRHAFSDFCKSNMLLNNLCETFNAVIKDARDKPILTQMEWLRKYMMKRNSEKWEGVQKLDCKNMPYVTKVFGRMEPVARHCIVQISRGDLYEVELNGDQVQVDLGLRKCSCYHWELTGIPCVHAFACILDKRVDPDDYVDGYYSRDTYLLAYEHSIKPMPGPRHWDRTNLRQPLPPPIRVMPGRPKSKKRKLEKGERAQDSKNEQPKKQKVQKRCKKCGQLGHYAKTCGNEPMMSAATSEPRTSTKPVQNIPWLQEQRRKKAERALRNTAVGAGPWSIANRTFPQEQQRQQQGQVVCSQQSQVSTAATAPVPKKQAKGKKKVV